MAILAMAVLAMMRRAKVGMHTDERLTALLYLL